MTLFSRKGCKKCDYVKELDVFKKLNIKVDELSDTNIDALAHLAWHEGVGISETMLPILVTDDSELISGAVPIKNYLLNLK